jgi:hypothetical protein
LQPEKKKCLEISGEKDELLKKNAELELKLIELHRLASTAEDEKKRVTIFKVHMMLKLLSLLNFGNLIPICLRNMKFIVMRLSATWLLFARKFMILLWTMGSLLLLMMSKRCLQVKCVIGCLLVLAHLRLLGALSESLLLL